MLPEGYTIERGRIVKSLLPDEETRRRFLTSECRGLPEPESEYPEYVEPERETEGDEDE